MKLYVAAFAPNPYKTRLAIAELGVPCDVIEMDVAKGENRSPEFRKTLNPNGKLPVLEDDGFVLWESNAILAYLGRKHADRKLWPADARGDADALRWLFYELATLQRPAGELWWDAWMYPRFGGMFERYDRPDESRKDLQRPLRVLDDHLASREFVLGAFSLVDCAFAAPLKMLELANEPVGAHPHVAAYWARLKARPSYAATPWKFPGEPRG